MKRFINNFTHEFGNLSPTEMNVLIFVASIITSAFYSALCNHEFSTPVFLSGLILFPVVTIIMVLTYGNEQKMSPYCWFLTGQVLSPIAMHIFSHTLDHLGFQTTANMMYEWRYGLLIGPYILLIAYLAVRLVVEPFRQPSRY